MTASPVKEYEAPPIPKPRKIGFKTYDEAKESSMDQNPIVISIDSEKNNATVSYFADISSGDQRLRRKDFKVT